MEGIEGAAGVLPGFRELPPVCVFMVASDEQDVSAGQFAQRIRTFLHGEPIFHSANHIEEIPNQRQNVRMMRLHGMSQASVMGFALVQIRCG